MGLMWYLLLGMVDSIFDGVKNVCLNCVWEINCNILGVSEKNGFQVKTDLNICRFKKPVQGSWTGFLYLDTTGIAWKQKE